MRLNSAQMELVKSETSLNLVMGGIRTHNLLIFGLTTRPSCLGTQQEDSGLPKAFDVEGQVDSLNRIGSQNE